MKKQEHQRETRKPIPGADLLAGPEMEPLADLTSKLLKVPKSELERKMVEERLARKKQSESPD